MARLQDGVARPDTQTRGPEWDMLNRGGERGNEVVKNKTRENLDAGKVGR